MAKRILLTGVTGYIGQYLFLYHPQNVMITGTCRNKNKWPANKTFPDTHFIPLELENDIYPQLEKINPDIIIHTAAMANLGACELDPLNAYRTNAQATSELARWAVERNSRFIYLSTDIVFDGENTYYNESSEPDPVNVYGKSKFEGEYAVQNNLDNFTIIRISLSAGKALDFNLNFVDWLLNQIKAKQKVCLFEDEIRTVAAITDIVKYIWHIALSTEVGIFHLAGGAAMNRFNFGSLVCRYLGYGQDLLVPVSCQENIDYPRPRDVSMVSTRTINGESLLLPGIDTRIKSILNRGGDIDFSS